MRLNTPETIYKIPALNTKPFFKVINPTKCKTMPINISIRNGNKRKLIMPAARALVESVWLAIVAPRLIINKIKTILKIQMK